MSVENEQKPGHGTVTIGEGEKSVTLEIAPLSPVEEDKLWTALADIGSRVNVGNLYRATKPLLAVMDATDRAVAVRDIVAKEMSRPNLIARALESNEGVALELFTRTRQQHKDMIEGHVKALVNDANREELFAKVREIVDGIKG